MQKEKIVRSPIFYMGNKYKLLKQLLPLFPNQCNTFVDLFGGSGVVSMNYKGTHKTIYNEFNDNVINLVKMIVDNDPQELDKYWKEKIEKYDLEKCSIKAKDRVSRVGYDRRKETYEKLRNDYNNSTERNYKDLYLLACYSINHLIRFNKNSDFNASSGADSYNEKNYQQVCDLHDRFKDVIISPNSAFDLNLNDLDKDTFIYCDPPYLNTEAVYNEERAFGGWNIDSDFQLFKLLEKANDMGLKFGVSNVFENRGKKNEHLIKWCEDNNWNVYHLNRNYNPFSRGNSNNDEVYICNYGKEETAMNKFLYCKNEHYELYKGEMQKVLDTLEENSIDSIVCDPPYELNFMGKGWDNQGIAFQPDTWKHCYNILKPGGYLLAFGGTRTYHRICCAIEDAGFEIRDCIMWLYGSGFPKSMNIGLAIDKRNGVESVDTGIKSPNARPNCNKDNTLYESGTVGKDFNIKKATNEWDDWGTCLKPAYEPIIVARKPFKGSLIDNVLEFGVGGLNIDECRIETSETLESGRNGRKKESLSQSSKPNEKEKEYQNLGRFPANVITDGSDEVAMGMPISEKTNGSVNKHYDYKNNVYSDLGKTPIFESYKDKGSAMRYFYQAKASKKDRDEGLELFEDSDFYVADNDHGNLGAFYVKKAGGSIGDSQKRKNTHPTVKPTALMQYLVRLVSPKGAKVLDCFMGSGSTGKACMFENRERNSDYYFIGIEMTDEYLPIAKARIDYAINEYTYATPVIIESVDENKKVKKEVLKETTLF